MNKQLIGDMVNRRTPELPEEKSELLKHHSHIGVEVELEKAYGLATHIMKDPETPWEVKGDGSLRDDGYEFVFKKPLAGKDVEQAIDQLSDAIIEHPVSSTVNCSTHVHLDFTKNTLDELFNFIFTYMLVEDTLAEYCGEWRKDNLYCLTFSNAENLVTVVSNMYHDRSLKPLLRYGENMLKYSALNMFTLYRFGTLEVRLAKGLSTKEDLYKWINMVYCIRKYADTVDNPMDLLVDVSRKGVNGLYEDIFEEYYEELSPFVSYENTYDAIDRIQYIISK